MANVMKLLAVVLLAAAVFVADFATSYLLVSASEASNVQNEQVVIKFRRCY